MEGMWVGQDSIFFNGLAMWEFDETLVCIWATQHTHTHTHTYARAHTHTKRWYLEGLWVLLHQNFTFPFLQFHMHLSCDALVNHGKAWQISNHFLLFLFCSGFLLLLLLFVCFTFLFLQYSINILDKHSALELYLWATRPFSHETEPC